ncbi:MAG TPA: hypothetical protein VEW66_02865, partial [Thermomicrobiales bacterium]|nr:hypothetical protein [Thermomicrobiales bacterium]
CAYTQGLREIDLFKSPGMAESLDWARALLALGSNELNDSVVEDTLGVVLKYQEDVDKIRGEISNRLVAKAVAASAAGA